jgi:hypothetical protein
MTTDLASRTTVIPPGEPDLKTLAAEIKALVADFKLTMISGCQKAVFLGKRLLIAKRLVQEQGGSWQEWLPANGDTDERQAQRWMQCAINEQKLLAATNGNLSKLTMTGAIKLIQELKDPDENTSSRGNGSNRSRKSPVDNAIQKDPVAMLKKAWDRCNSSQQDEFRQHIG